MRWDGTDWHPLGGGTNRSVRSLKVIDDELYAVGSFSHADTVFCNGFARWDGERWHKVVDVPNFYSGEPGGNLIWDVEKFNGDWYLGGRLPLVNDLARYNGSTWETVGGGFLGTFSLVRWLSARNGKLYVSGSFGQCPPYGVPTNPGSGIAAWDGQQWDDLAGGTCGSTNGTVHSMVWWRDTLYAAGQFNRMGGVEGDRLARWDGSRWCFLTPATNYWGNGSPGALAVWNDSLYVGGSFEQAGPVQALRFAKYIGGGITYNCSQPVSVPEEAEPVSFHLYPNPARTVLSLSGLPATADRVEVLDALGRTVLRERLVRPQVEIGHLAPGSYLLQVVDGQGQRLGGARFVKE